MQGFERGRQERDRRERASIEQKRLEAERDYYRSQTSLPYAPPAIAPPPLSELTDPPYGNLSSIAPQTSVAAPLAVRQKIGEHLKAGECTSDMNLALDIGDIELAQSVRDFCKANE